MPDSEAVLNYTERSVLSSVKPVGNLGVFAYKQVWRCEQKGFYGKEIG